MRKGILCGAIAILLLRAATLWAPIEKSQGLDGDWWVEDRACQVCGVTAVAKQAEQHSLCIVTYNSMKTPELQPAAPTLDDLWADRSNAIQSPWLEYGLSDQIAQPHLTPIHSPPFKVPIA